MDYSFLIDLEESIMGFVMLIGDIFDTKLSDILGDWSVGILGDFADTTLLTFMATAGLLVILGYNLAKWAIPFFE